MATARLWLKRLRRLGEAKLPVAVVGGDHRAGAQPRLHAVLVAAGNQHRGFEQAPLNFGDGGQRDFDRQHVIEDMIVPQIGVGEHIIADALGRSQAAAMADHQPDLGPKHRDVVADRLRVRRADADVHQGDPDVPVGDQVIGRHLVPAPRTRGDLRLGVRRMLAVVIAAGNGQRRVRAVRPAQLVDREAHELVDVADVVGEQDEVLEMVGVGAGVVLQPRKAEVGARAVEQRQRPGVANRIVPDAVGDLVADMRQLVGREPARQIGGRHLVEIDAASVEHIGIGNFAAAFADRDFDPIVLDQML